LISLHIDKIRADGGTQSRAAINQDTVAEYAEAMADPETVFPPVRVYHDGREYWLADGFHRLEAWRQIGCVEVPAEVRQGDRRQAVLHSCGANSAHGLRRSNADKRRAVTVMLEDDEWSQWSDAEIARRCGVSRPLVADCRSGLTVNSACEPRAYITKHGTEARMDTSRIGKPTDGQPDAASVPVHKPLDNSKADKAGISVGKPDTADARDSIGTPADGPAPDDEPHDPVHAEKLDAPADTDPHRAGLSGLTREGLEDEVAGLRAENTDLRGRVDKQRSEIADLKARVKELSADNKGATIASLQKRMEAANYRRDEAMRVAKREEYKRKQAEKRLAEVEQVEVPY